MSGGDEDNATYRPEGVIELYRKHPDLLAYMKEPYDLDLGHHIPWIGGISTDGKIVYIDWKFGSLTTRNNGKIIDVSKFISVHEKFEWWMMTKLDYGYTIAHHWANTAENMALLEAGYSHVFYNKFVEKDRLRIEDAPLTNIPRVLYTGPYTTEPKILEAIRHGS
jgi:hypothetical protein